MARIDSSDISIEGHRVTHIRMDRIGSAGARELWWVALAFEDESTKPEGMFADVEAASALAKELAAEWGTEVVITKVI